MSLVTELKQQNIIIPPPEKNTTLQIDCPQSYCKSSRAKDDKTPLKVEIVLPGYAEWRCRHCLWSGHIGDAPAVAEIDTVTELPKTRTRALPQEALDYLAGKGITEDDAAKYKLSWDRTKKAIKIPYFEGEKVVNHALVRITDGKSKLENPDKAVFFGIDKLGQNSEPVIIAQRELDAIVLMERGFINVLGIPNGGDIAAEGDDFNHEPDKFAYLSHAAQQAKQWHQVKFAFDDTKDGLALRQELARRLGPGRCAVAKLTKGSVWATMQQLGGDMLCADINEAKALPIFGLFSVSDFEKELYAYFEYGMAAGVSTGWPNVDKLYTIVPGQLTVVTGIPNSGKSEWLDALSINLALNFGWRFAAFSPENGKEAHTTKLVEKRVEMSADPKAYRRMSFDTLKAGAKWVDTHYTFIESTDVMPTLEWILERAKDAALRYGIKGLIIDPWNRIEKVLAGKSETDYVAESIPKILRFAANYGVHVWLVVHPKQQQKNHKTGKIDAPSLYDMAGSAHFVNMCDNGVVIHRSDSIDDTTEVLLRKVRFKHVGRRGETKLKYDTQSGRFAPLDEEVSAEQKAASDKYKSASNGDDDAIVTYEVD